MINLAELEHTTQDSIVNISRHTKYMAILTIVYVIALVALLIVLF
jgi:hypothetical protein